MENEIAPSLAASADLEAMPQRSEATSIEEHEPISKRDGWTEDYVMDFDGPDDKSDPRNWHIGYQWSTCALISSITLMTCVKLPPYLHAGDSDWGSIVVTIVSAPAAPQILDEFYQSNALYSTILVSVWAIAEVAGPLVIAPLAELHGKLPVYHAANVLFLICSLGAGASQTRAGIIVCRFFNEVAVASGTLIPGIVGDLFAPEQRGRTLSLMGLVALIGPVLGPIIGGYLTAAYGW